MPVDFAYLSKYDMPDAAMLVVIEAIRRIPEIQEVFSFGEFFSADEASEIAHHVQTGDVAAVSIQQIIPIEGSQSTTHKTAADEIHFQIFAVAQDLYDRGNQHYRALRAAQRIRAQLQGEFLLPDSKELIQSAPMKFESIHRYVDSGAMGIYRLTMTMRTKYIL